MRTLNVTWPSQAFSNLKHELFGTLVKAVSKSGTWSETERVSEERQVFGNTVSQSRLTRHLSSLTKVGVALLLLQV